MARTFLGNIYGQVNSEHQEGHNAVFPQWMPLYFLKYFSLERDIIFDPFMGSGTTAIACLKTNRRFIGCEISKKYCDIAEKRIKDYQDQLKLVL